jgi:SprT protein
MTTVYEAQKKLHISRQQRDRVETAVMDCVLMAEKRFGKGIPIPEIRYDLVGGSAGQAVYDRRGNVKHTIRINPILLNENESYVILQTVPHEMAHVVVHHLYDDLGISVKGHGSEWKRIMYLFGLEPHRCHQLDISSIRAVRKQSTYRFTCSCVGKVFELSKNKYTRWANGTAYRCPRCREQIRFDRVVKP